MTQPNICLQEVIFFTPIHTKSRVKVIEEASYSVDHCFAFFASLKLNTEETSQAYEHQTLKKWFALLLQCSYTKRIHITLLCRVCFVSHSFDTLLKISLLPLNQLDEPSQEATPSNSDASNSASVNYGNGIASKLEDPRVESARRVNFSYVCVAIFVSLLSVSAMYLINQKPYLFQ